MYNGFLYRYWLWSECYFQRNARHAQVFGDLSMQVCMKLSFDKNSERMPPGATGPVTLSWACDLAAWLGHPEAAGREGWEILGVGETSNQSEKGCAVLTPVKDCWNTFHHSSNDASPKHHCQTSTSILINGWWSSMSNQWKHPNKQHLIRVHAALTERWMLASMNWLKRRMRLQADDPWLPERKIRWFPT